MEGIFRIPTILFQFVCLCVFFEFSDLDRIFGCYGCRYWRTFWPERATGGRRPPQVARSGSERNPLGKVLRRGGRGDTVWRRLVQRCGWPNISFVREPKMLQKLSKPSKMLQKLFKKTMSDIRKLPKTKRPTRSKSCRKHAKARYSKINIVVGKPPQVCADAVPGF